MEKDFKKIQFENKLLKSTNTLLKDELEVVREENRQVRVSKLILYKFIL